MQRYIKYLVVSVILAATPVAVYAQQTIEEATDSIKNILALAKKGDAVAQNEVGGWYYRGRHVKQDFTEALQWWAKSAKQGNLKAIGNMGLCYQTGHGIAADSLMAVKLYQRSIKGGNKALFERNVELAEKGSVFSNMLIASCYQNGIGVSKDINKAIPFLIAAANKNSVVAQRDLGLLYLNDKKPAEAAKWFRKGADKGELTSIFYYGKLLLEGKGVKQDKKDGANFMLKAAEAGFPQAMFYLGNCYMNGDGVTKNADQAVKWYKQAAGKGVSNAQWVLAECLREGNGVAVNFDQALYWYAECATKGHERAFKNLVNDSIPASPFVAYLKGMKAYLNKDYEGALKEFKEVTKEKIADGKVMEAAILANSGYAKHNIKKGVKLLNQVAAEGNAQAMYILGGLYEAGKGVEKDMATAVEYMTKAADEGYGAAQCALGDMYYEGRGVDKNYENAIKYYEMAYLQGQLTVNAAKRYASCYAEGKGGLDANESKATEILDSVHQSKIATLLNLI